MTQQPVSYAWVLFIFIPMIPYSQAQQDCFGPCVPINECPALSDTLRLAHTGNSAALQKLRSAVCSNDNGLKVCCQPESVPEGFPERCGGQNKTERIVGGENAPLKAWPWMALLRATAGDFTKWVCGGVLINSRFVLTAAHCTTRRVGVDLVRLGELVLNQNPDSSIDITAPQPQDIDIEKIISHPKYKSPCPKCNDIALIKLARPARIDHEFVETICLNRSPSINIDAPTGWVAGWGLSVANPYIFSQTKHLQQLQVPIQELDFCKNRKQGSGYPDPNMIFCAGGEKGKDTCRGDSGGPIMVATKDHVWYTIGVVSFGNTICGATGSQTVFTNIEYYLPWIEENILQ